MKASKLTNYHLNTNAVSIDYGQPKGLPGFPIPAPPGLQRKCGSPQILLEPKGRRKVWKSGGAIVMGGHNQPPLVEIGLTDLPKSGDACKLHFLAAEDTEATNQ